LARGFSLFILNFLLLKIANFQDKLYYKLFLLLQLHSDGNWVQIRNFFKFLFYSRNSMHYQKLVNNSKKKSFKNSKFLINWGWKCWNNYGIIKKK